MALNLGLLVWPDTLELHCLRTDSLIEVGLEDHQFFILFVNLVFQIVELIFHRADEGIDGIKSFHIVSSIRLMVVEDVVKNLLLLACTHLASSYCGRNILNLAHIKV